MTVVFQIYSNKSTYFIMWQLYNYKKENTFTSFVHSVAERLKSSSVNNFINPGSFFLHLFQIYNINILSE